MFARFKNLLICALLVLPLVVVGCGEEPTPVPADTPVAADTPQPTDVPAPTSTTPPEPTATTPPEPTATTPPEPTAAPAVTLGEEQRSEEGGFAFQAIPGYTVEEFYGFVSVEAPDAEPDIGPAILMMGEAQ